jgi:hypothetical protein
MKKQIIQFAYLVTFQVALLTFLFANAAHGQTVTRDASGNFSATGRTAQAAHDSTTVFTFTDANGKIFPVYVGSKGSFYVARVSGKTGKFYRQYLPKEDK